jgi:hypothetical protein
MNPTVDGGPDSPSEENIYHIFGNHMVCRLYEHSYVAKGPFPDQRIYCTVGSSLPSDATELLVFFLNQSSMPSSPVGYQKAVTVERFATQCATEWLLACVNSDMMIKLALL